MLGVQRGPVRSEVAAVLLMWTLFFSRQMSFTASATEEVVTSRITSTPSRSIHWRAMLEPTSGLFWWSANRISTLKPRGPKSCTAWRAQTAEDWPEMSRYIPEPSFSTPILTVFACARAARNGARRRRPGPEGRRRS